jgi:hypothetical protein
MRSLSHPEAVRGRVDERLTGSAVECQKSHAFGMGWGYDTSPQNGWQHDIVVEEELPWEKGSWIPVCLDGACACPPEDCGGPLGYAAMLEPITDLPQERHEEPKRCINGKGTGAFDPEKFDLGLTNKILKWTAQDLRRRAPCRQPMGSGHKFGNKTPPNTLLNRDT